MSPFYYDSSSRATRRQRKEKGESRRNRGEGQMVKGRMMSTTSEVYKDRLSGDGQKRECVKEVERGDRDPAVENEGRAKFEGFAEGTQVEARWLEPSSDGA